MKVHTFLKSRTVPIAVAVIAVAVMGVTRLSALRSERYFVKQIPISGQIAWRKPDREMGTQRVLVAVTYASQGRHGSRLRTMLLWAGEALGLVTEIPEPLQTTMELTAVDFSHTQASSKAVTFSTLQSPATGFMAAHLVAHDGKLYLLGFGPLDEEFDTAQAVDLVPENFAEDFKGWRFENNRFIEISSQETRTVRESISREHQDSQHLSEPNQSAAWQACTEGVDSFSQRARCQMKVGGSTWTLSFNSAKLNSLDGPIFAQLSGDGVDKVRLTNDSNIWMETTATDYTSRQHQSQKLLAPYSRIRVVYGWGGTVFGLLVAIGVPFLLIRSALVRVTNSKPYFPDAKPEDFCGIDSKKLEYFSEFLLANGFKQLRDFTVASTTLTPTRPASFARLFVNPDTNCFAEISQIFTPQKVSAGMHLSFMTAFEGDWRYSTTDRVLDSMTYVARRPHTLWLSRPGMSCGEMLSLHQQMINQMKMQLGLSVVEDVSVEGHFLRCAQSVDELNRIIRKKSFWLLPLIFEHQYHARRNHYEWLGTSGLTVPATPWTPPAEDARDSSLLGTINRLAPVLNFACTVMLCFSAYLMFFHPSNSVAAARFRVGLFALGLAGSALLALAKKKAAKS